MSHGHLVMHMVLTNAFYDVAVVLLLCYILFSILYILHIYFIYFEIYIFC